MTLVKLVANIVCVWPVSNSEFKLAFIDFVITKTPFHLQMYSVFNVAHNRVFHMQVHQLTLHCGRDAFLSLSRHSMKSIKIIIVDCLRTLVLIKVLFRTSSFLSFGAFLSTICFIKNNFHYNLFSRMIWISVDCRKMWIFSMLSI